MSVCMCEFVRFFKKKCDTFENYLLKWYGGSRALGNKIVFGNRFDDDKKGLSKSVSVSVRESVCDDINISYYVFVACNGQRDDSLYNISFCSINSIGNGITYTHTTHFLLLRVVSLVCPFLARNAHVHRYLATYDFFLSLSPSDASATFFLISRAKVTANNLQIQKR